MALSWLRSYLTDCYQLVDASGDFFMHNKVKTGVPQGLLCVFFCCVFVGEGEGVLTK